MTDKKAETQNEVKPIGKVEILVYDNGEVKVSGPHANPALMMHIVGKAMCATANHIAAAERQGDIVPA
jgi:hypothetical protein